MCPLLVVTVLCDPGSATCLAYGTGPQVHHMGCPRKHTPHILYCIYTHASSSSKDPRNETHDSLLVLFVFSTQQQHEKKQLRRTYLCPWNTRIDIKMRDVSPPSVSWLLTPKSSSRINKKTSSLYYFVPRCGPKVHPRLIFSDAAYTCATDDFQLMTRLTAHPVDRPPNTLYNDSPRAALPDIMRSCIAS